MKDSTDQHQPTLLLDSRIYQSNPDSAAEIDLQKVINIDLQTTF